MIDAIKLSGQSSYARRQPNKKAIPLLVAALAGLREFVKQDGENAEVWLLISLGEECLLRHREAIESLELAIRLNPKMDQKKHQKRLALLRSARLEWERLSLSPAQLADLATFLESSLRSDFERSQSFKHTRRWLQGCGIQPEPIINEFEARGAFDDYQVLWNVAKA